MMTNRHRALPTPSTPPRRKPRGLVAASLVVVTLSSPAAPLLAHNPWPLVKDAEGAVWGSLIEIREGVQERLLVIAAGHVLKGAGIAAPGTLQLVWPTAHLPDSGFVTLGDTGIFLFDRELRPGHDLEPADGVWLAHGFIPLAKFAPVRRDLTNLISFRSDREGEDWAPVVRLLESEQPGCRRMTLGWLLGRSMQLPITLQPPLRAAFFAEADPENQSLFLEVFLLAGWDLAGDAAAGFIITHDDPRLTELSILYLRRHPTASAHGTLLDAYRQVPPDRRPRLLEVYGRLRIRAAYPLIFDALLSEEEAEFGAALYALSRSDEPAAVDVHLELLESDRPDVQRRALSGLAALSTPRSLQALRELGESTEPSPLRDFAREVLKHPYRYAGVSDSVGTRAGAPAGERASEER